MSAWAKPGVRCVLIADRWQDLETSIATEPPGQVGQIFKIVSISIVDGQKYLGLWGTPLGEIWNAAGFRPLVIAKRSLKQDIAKFKKIAGHVPAPEKERA